MEKLVLPYDMECMKMAMLKHEETFKQQVYELHRLYRIQRMLMKNMQRSMQSNQETWSLKNGTISFEYHQSDYNFNKIQTQDLEQQTSNGYDQIEDEREIELTLGPTSYTTRRMMNKNNPIQLNSDSIASFSSSSTSSTHKSRITVENSRVLSVEKQLRQVDRSLNQPPWLRRVLI